MFRSRIYLLSLSCLACLAGSSARAQLPFGIDGQQSLPDREEREAQPFSPDVGPAQPIPEREHIEGQPVAPQGGGPGQPLPKREHIDDQVVLSVPLHIDEAMLNGHPAVAPGYDLFARVTGLDFPTAVAFAPGHIWVAEGGFLPGFAPKIKEVAFDRPGGITLLSAEDLPANQLVGPLTDVTFHNKWLWITHRQLGANGWMVGAVSKFQIADPVGTFETVLTNLPSAGDHSTNEVIFDASGRGYFSQGTATNTGVVGADNANWLMQTPAFHDFAPIPLMLNGIDYTTVVPFPLDQTATAVTGPYHIFGSGPISPGTSVGAASWFNPQQGMIAGNGAIYSFLPTAMIPAATLKLEAWGLRNPYGMGFDPFVPETLYVTNNGGDIRVDESLQLTGTRPIARDLDDLYTLHIGGHVDFFGWPDFFHVAAPSVSVKPVTDPQFCDSPANIPIPCPEAILDPVFSASWPVRNAKALLEDHCSANKLDFSTSSAFGFVGDVFLAESGSMPHTGAQQFSGFKVVRVARATEQVFDFVVNTGDTPAEVFDPTNFNKPIDVKFNGAVMLIVDLGAFDPVLGIALPGSGKVWVVTHQ